MEVPGTKRFIPKGFEFGTTLLYVPFNPSILRSILKSPCDVYFFHGFLTFPLNIYNVWSVVFKTFSPIVYVHFLAGL